MRKEKSLTLACAARALEMVGCGAVVGAIAFTIIAGFITDAKSVPLMTYSPFIGALFGGAVSFAVILFADFKSTQGK
ncbi:hypothetical protein IBX65_05885 [Candidatus Aerophobetes bacterium]|nr:hypothetical protein [Candidatus Aerophobetes bacterium]